MRKRDIRAQRKEKRELWEEDPDPDQEEMHEAIDWWLHDKEQEQERRYE